MTDENNVEVVEEFQDVDPEPASAPESLRDSIQNAIKETSANSSEDDIEDTFTLKSDDDSNEEGLGKAESKEAPVETNKAPEIIAAPLSWPAAEKERFKSLPIEAQKFIAKREEERERYVSTKANEVAKFSQEYNEIENAFKPFERDLQLNGTSKASVVKQLLAAQKFLDENPTEALHWLAQSYGLNLSDVANRNIDVPRVDPTILQLQNEVNSLKGHLTNQQQQEYSKAYASVNSLIANFAAETDAQGNYLRPHFNEVYNDMEAIVRQIKASQPEMPVQEVLQQAYDRAVWANPVSREAMLAREKQKLSANHLTEAKRKAEKARIMGSSVTGAPTSSASPAISGNLRDVIENALSRHYQ